MGKRYQIDGETMTDRPGERVVVVTDQRTGRKIKLPASVTSDPAQAVELAKRATGVPLHAPTQNYAASPVRGRVTDESIDPRTGSLNYRVEMLDAGNTRIKHYPSREAAAADNVSLSYGPPAPNARTREFERVLAELRQRYPHLAPTPPQSQGYVSTVDPLLARRDAMMAPIYRGMMHQPATNAGPADEMSPGDTYPNTPLGQLLLRYPQLRGR